MEKVNQFALFEFLGNKVLLTENVVFDIIGSLNGQALPSLQSSTYYWTKPLPAVAGGDGDPPAFDLAELGV